MRERPAALPPEDVAILKDPARRVPVRWVAAATCREELLGGKQIPLSDVLWWIELPPVPKRSKRRQV